MRKRQRRTQITVTCYCVNAGESKENMDFAFEIRVVPATNTLCHAGWNHSSV